MESIPVPLGLGMLLLARSGVLPVDPVGDGTPGEEVPLETEGVSGDELAPLSPGDEPPLETEGTPETGLPEVFPPELEPSHVGDEASGEGLGLCPPGDEASGEGFEPCPPLETDGVGPAVSFPPGVEPPPDGDGVSGEELGPLPPEEAPPLEIGGTPG